MSVQILDTDQKALEINLNEKIYGTIAEIGAGQEVARIFFKVGAAAGTIAKTMSAYDKVYSDEIYGVEPTGRYVCENRLYKMLDHEYKLIEQRLRQLKPKTNFFVFADTIAAINYSRTVSGHGWMGIRFQLHPDAPPNDIVLHVKMLDRDNQLQAAAIGTLGVNLVYACFHHNKDPEILVKSLIDQLRGRVVVDLIRMTGPDFEHLDNRWLSLLLVKHGLTEVTMFGPDGRPVHGSEFLYRKSLMVARGHYRPPTLVSVDALMSSFQQFQNESDIDPDRAFIMPEFTLEYLNVAGKITEQDFLDRADALCSMGHTIIVSNCSNHQGLINYLADFKIQHLGLVIGVRELLEIINEKYYQNRDGRLLVAFGELFTRGIKIYTYPALIEDQLITARSLPVPEGIKFLYQYLLDSNHVVEVTHYNAELLHIFPQNVLEMIQQGESGWEEVMPPELVTRIKKNRMFGWNQPRSSAS